MTNRFKNKVVFLTGACSGIGLATTHRFMAEGAQLLAADIQDDMGAKLEAQYPGQLRYVHCDVTQPEQIRQAIDAAVAHFGGLDVVFNNAGAGGHRGGMEEMTIEGWDQTMALLLRSVMAGTLYALPHLKKRGGGAIVNTSSISALGSGYASLAYSTAKAAVLHYSKLCAADLARHRIRVNAVVPGFIATSIFGNALGLDAQATARMVESIVANGAGMQPVARSGSPDDIAQAVLFLASDDAGFVTGTHVVVDGGITIGTPASWNPDSPNLIHQALGLKARAEPASNR